MFEKMALKLMLKRWDKGGFTVVFWDGETENYGTEPPAFKIVFKKEPPLAFGEDLILAVGEAYMDGIIEIEGDMDDVLKVLALNMPHKIEHHDFGKAHENFNPQIQQRNIHHHYDLGNDFFALWLDKTMSYSCAYFKTADDSLYQAQLQKIDHILKKLNLHPGEKLLDIGCGWGWLILRAAQQYQVKATGITLSTEQYEGTKARIEQLGLQDLVDVQLKNYQQLDPAKLRFDKIVSVGMFEHVGKGNLEQYMQKIHDLLVDGGVSMIHTITGMFEEDGNSWIKKHIFPGGYVPSLRETVWLLPEYEFHLLHAESLRLHYARTLDFWYQNFSRHSEEIQEKYGEKFVRMWSLYLRGCAAAFRVSGLDIHQLLFSKGLNNHLPFTYEHVYEPTSQVNEWNSTHSEERRIPSHP